MRLVAFIASVFRIIFCLPVFSHGLQCHDCSGKQDCESLITLFPGRSGRCQIELGKGKCFIRKDPNNVIYWGCIDDVFWPGVPWRTLNGCQSDWDRAWELDGVRRPMIWCFCDRDDCNVSIQQVNGTNWDALHAETTTPPAPATTPSVALTSLTTTALTPIGITSSPASCPPDFFANSNLTSCYKVVSPTDSSRDLSRDHVSAVRECQALNAELASIDSIEEQQFLATVLSSEPVILDGWQGWWTSGQFVRGINQFVWYPFNRYLPANSRLWGFMRTPVEDTCVWILSISYYRYSLANYDCYTKAGYVCEIELG